MLLVLVVNVKKGVVASGRDPTPHVGRNTLRNPDRLNDLEDCGPAHHEDEQRQQPRTDRVLLLGVLRRLGDVSALGDVAASLLVGHADSLLGGHCALCWVEWGTCKSLEQDEKMAIGARSEKETTVLCTPVPMK